MKLFVPAVNDYVKLAQDWEFPLHTEHRNINLCKLLKPNVDWNSREAIYVTSSGYGRTELRTIMATLPRGTLLRVTRVYIRAGASADFNSLTFEIVSVPEDTNIILPNSKRISDRVRFWAKLADVNLVDIEEPGTFETPKNKRKAAANG